MKLLGSRLLLLAAFFTFSSAYFTTTSDLSSLRRTSSPYVSSQLCLLEVDDSFTIPQSGTASSFSASYKNEAVHIAWEVKAPKKGSYYMVQRSEDGVEWYTIGGIAIREGLSSKQTYEMTDANLKARTYHYKLKEIQPDGSIVFSSSVSVYAGYDKPLTLYPNPADSYFFFDLPSNLEGRTFMELLDQNGRLLLKESLDDNFNRTRQIIIEDLPAGVYFVRIYTNDQRYTGRIIKK